MGHIQCMYELRHYVDPDGQDLFDGVIGPKTRAALAAADQGVLYGKVLGQRLRHLGRLITNDPKQSAFAAGWMNRMAEFVEGTV